MAPKTKSRLVDQPPSASSSEEQVEESQGEQSEEEEEGQEEEEDSGEETEEEEEPKTAPPVEKKFTTQKSVQTPPKPQSSSESGTENGSGSESASDSGQSQPSPSASDFTVKPSVPAKAAAPSKPAAKRLQPQEPPTQKDKDSRRKKPKIAEEEEKKSAATPRSLWSDDDQLTILKGMVEYKAQKGTEPNADMSAFYEFIKGKLQADVSKSQLTDKVRRLKKKFFTNMSHGEDPVFAKGQDYLVFEFSKKIWGAPGNNVVKENVDNSINGKAKKVTVAVKKSAEPKKSGKVSTFNKPKDDEKQVAVKEVVKEDMVKGDQQDFRSKYPCLAASFENESVGGMSKIYPNGTGWLKENMSLIASDKAKVLEEKWKKLHDDEAALMLKRLDLIAEHYRLVVDAMRGN